MTNIQRPLHQGFVDSVARAPDHTALIIGDDTYSYQQLHALCASIAVTLNQHDSCSHGLAAVYAGKGVTAIAGILGTLMSGRGYVPLSPSHPVERAASMLARSGCKSLVLGEDSLDKGASLLALTPTIDTIILPHGVDRERALEALAEFKGRVVTAAELPAAELWAAPVIKEDAVAYLLFTSGSTGEPKGVMVAQQNIRRFIDVMQERYALQPEDRLSQMFEFVFDLSLFDIFMAWEAGATLCIPTRHQLMIPAKYITDLGISVWFSVPSSALLMNKLGLLKPGVYPSLRISLFCGEGLPCETAEAWAAAAPDSIVENLYGPTELTLACTLYRWTGEESRQHARNEMVPIGEPYPAMEAVLVDEHLQEVPAGSPGELVMSGPQVALGYWQDTAKTDAAFVTLPDRAGRFYRTGDMAVRETPDAPLVWLGRVDHQVKVHGHRVELGEIEAAIRNAIDCHNVAVIPWPVQDGTAHGLVAFIESGDPSCVDNLTAALAARLPDYMVPKTCNVVEHLPLNTNGKVDRNQLKATLEE